MFTKLRSSLSGYSPEFWILISAIFIDSLGGYMLYPFWAFFVSSQFGVGATEIGLVFTAFAVGSIIGNILGGASADKIGRKFTIIFGLVSSALIGLTMLLFNSIEGFYVISIAAGLLGGFGEPARTATLTDILPIDKRAEGFGIFRIAFNVSATIGPLIGAFVLAAAGNYIVLFILDSISSVTCAIIVFIKIPETKPKENQSIDETEHSEQDQSTQTKKTRTKISFMQTMRGYVEVLKDGKFILFVLIAALTNLVYQSMNASLPIFLLSEHGFDEKHFGFLLSLNALMVICLQFLVSRATNKYPSLIMMAVGTSLYAIGFAMYGYVSQIWLFFIAMVIITFGEMTGSPHGNAVVGLFSSEDKRGRYAAISAFSWMIPSLFGYALMGYILDNFNPKLVWWIMGGVGIVAVGGYILLHKLTQKRFSRVIEDEIKK